MTSCPRDLVRYLDGVTRSDTRRVDWARPLVTDNKDVGLFANEVLGRDEFGILAEGRHTIKFTASDAAGNEALPCVFNVFVQSNLSYLYWFSNLKC